eukprot:Pgem_evm1s14672
MNPIIFNDDAENSLEVYSYDLENWGLRVAGCGIEIGFWFWFWFAVAVAVTVVVADADADAVAVAVTIGCKHVNINRYN